jgi:rhamnosyltransferase
METSIIIRVKNERKNLEKLFKILKSQTYQNFEVIIVDNNSTDGSDKLVYNYLTKNRIQIIKINKFSYSRACNIGTEKANGKYIVFLSAHSFPVSNTWLSDGLSNFEKENIAGVFAYPITGKDSSFAERILYGVPNRFKKAGDLGNTNSIIRKELWVKHKFDESLIISEDLEWSTYWKRKGYEIKNDPRFTVYHSHHLGLPGIIKQELKWQKARTVINKKFKN